VTDAIPVTSGLFDVGPDGDGRLLGGHCAACTRYHFPASPDCPYCGASECQSRPLATRGTLCLFTTVSNRPPGYRGEMPFGFGVVELPEGLRVITRLTETDVGRLQLGQAVRLVIVPLHVEDDGRQVVTYAFAPERTEAAAGSA
jgi:uncharacterized protein